MYHYLLADIATLVGYTVVSKPFIDLTTPKYLNSTHSQRLEVSDLEHNNHIFVIFRVIISLTFCNIVPLVLIPQECVSVFSVEQNFYTPQLPSDSV